MNPTQTHAYVAPANRPEMTERECILQCLDSWIRQRPGLEFGNYGDVVAYRSELRGITRDGNQAKQLLRYVALHESITADYLREAFRSAFSGRLSWNPAKRSIDYCTGQYWPTEYRRAACAVLASAVWSWMREECLPPVTGYRIDEWGKPGQGSRTFTARAEAEAECDQQTGHVVELVGGMSAGDYLRKSARREFGASIQKRWFN